MSRRRSGIGGFAVAMVLATPALVFAQPVEERPASELPADVPPAFSPAFPAPPVPRRPLASRSTFDERPFARLLPLFWSDVKRLPSLDSALVVGLGGAMAGVARKNDEYLTAHASAGGTDQIFAVGGAFGDGRTQVGLALGTYVAGRLTRRRTVAHVGGDLIRAQMLTGVMTRGLKAVSRRVRPAGPTEGQSSSFPSGHSSASWTTATVLWRHLGWKVGMPASLVAAYASASRLQQREHYMSDVLFGAAIGIASARTVTIGHRSRQLIVAPRPVPGGAAVSFTLVQP